jgi:ubiquinol-cytochrome c reductase cytochrome b subunit
MMIKLARNAEANAKVQPKKPTTKSSINLTEKWIYGIFIALLAFQVYLNIAAYYAVLSGMKNYSLFIIGIMMLVFAGMFHIFRHGKSMQKAPPPKPTLPPMPAKARPPSLMKTGTSEAPQIAAATKELGNSVAKENTVAPSAKASSPSASSGSSASESSTSALSSVQSTPKTESTGTQSEQKIVTDKKK